MRELGIVKIGEKWNGTYGAHYVYVAEGNTLIHISKYAVKTNKDDKWIYYEVPIHRVLGKDVYCFSFSNAGSAFIAKCNIDSFDEDGWLKIKKMRIL